MYVCILYNIQCSVLTTTTTTTSQGERLCVRVCPLFIWAVGGGVRTIVDCAGSVGRVDNDACVCMCGCVYV